MKVIRTGSDPSILKTNCFQYVSMLKTMQNILVFQAFIWYIICYIYATICVSLLMCHIILEALEELLNYWLLTSEIHFLHFLNNMHNEKPLKSIFITSDLTSHFLLRTAYFGLLISYFFFSKLWLQTTNFMISYFRLPTSRPLTSNYITYNFMTSNFLLLTLWPLLLTS